MSQNLRTLKISEELAEQVLSLFPPNTTLQDSVSALCALAVKADPAFLSAPQKELAGHVKDIVCENLQAKNVRDLDRRISRMAERQETILFSLAYLLAANVDELMEEPESAESILFDQQGVEDTLLQISSQTRQLKESILHKQNLKKRRKAAGQ